MILGSEIDSPAVRFGLYIDELQGFFASRGMHFGSPEDIFRLAERLSAPSFFYDEMSSMVRAIIYREFEGVSREELLELVAVAISGPHIDLTAARFQEPVRQLLTFFGGVMRSLFKAFPEELSGDAVSVATEDVAAEQAEEPLLVAAEPEQAPAMADVRAQIQPPASAVVSELANDPDEDPNRDVLHRARAALERAVPPVPVVLPSEESYSPAHAGTGVVRDGSLGQRRWRPSFWIPGICGVLLGLVIGLLLRYRPPLLEAPALDIAQTQRPAVTAGPKPTPYELPIRDTRVPAEGPSFHGLITPSSGVVAHRARVWPHEAASSYAAQAVPRKAEAPSLPAQARASTQVLSYPRQADPVLAESYARPSTPAASASVFSDAPRVVSLTPAAPVSSETRPSVFLASSGVMAANLLFAPAPEYPNQARTAGVQGRVVLQALVWRDGTIAATHVLRGDRVLGAAAEDAVRHWRYRPYVVDGRASDVATIVTVDFRLLR